MTTNEKLFVLTELAEASYANLQNVGNKSVLKERLQRDLVDKNDLLSPSQAADIASHWEVAAHQPDTLGGFSATLFRSLDNEGYVLACRGTASGSDYAADLGDIVRDGIALDQIVDLYNFWQQIQAEEGNAYAVAKLQTLSEESGLYSLAKQLIAQAYVCGL